MSKSTSTTRKRTASKLPATKRPASKRNTDTMDAAKRKRLERAGFTVGTAADFLELSPEEAALIEMHRSLSHTLREQRVAAGLTQATLAKRIGSSQSRVAKMEAGDPSVSLDLLIRALLATGASRRVVGQALARHVA